MIGDAAMQWLGQFMLRATVLVVVVGAAALLLRRRSAALRRWVMHAGLIGLALLPLVTSLALTFPVPIPGWSRSLAEPPPVPLFEPVRMSVEPPYAVAPPPAPRAAPMRVTDLAPDRWRPPACLVGLWATGALVMLARSLRARLRVNRWVARSRPADATCWPAIKGLRVRESDDVAAPITAGVLRPVVLVPAQGTRWTTSWRRMALCHEHAHVVSGDPWWQLLTELVRACYWFHPLVHALIGTLHAAREEAADDHALRSENADPVELASLLYTLASEREHPATTGAVVPILARRGLKARVLSLLDDRRARTPLTGARCWSVAAVAAPLVGLISVALPAASAPPAVLLDVRAGRVVDAQRRPVPGADVEIFTDTGLPVGRTRTDRDGWFHRAPGPHRWPAGGLFVAYVRKGSAAGRKPLRPSPDDPEAIIELRTGVSLRGVVRDEQGQPTPGAHVRLARAQSWAVGPFAPVITDGAGSFVIDGILPGSYWVVAQAAGATLGSRPVDVADQPLSGLDLTVAAVPPVSGRVVDEKGNPIARARISRNGRQSDVDDADRRHVDWDLTGADGTFRIVPTGPDSWQVQGPADALQMLAPGGFSLGVVGSRSSNPLEPLRYGFSVWSGRRVPGAIRPGRPVEIVLVPGAMVEGYVQDASGRPVGGARVHTEFPPMASATTSQDGRLLLGPVPTGPIKLFIVRPPSGPSLHVRRAPTTIVAGEQRQTHVFTIP